MSISQPLNNSSLLLKHLLPGFFCLKLIAWELNEAKNQLLIQVKTLERQAVCPICSKETQKVHSHYQRTLADVAWGSIQVCLKLITKKFFCSNR